MDIVDRLRAAGGFVDGTDIAAADMADEIAKLRADNKSLTGLVIKLGNAAIICSDHAGDEGDRAYFGSTNHLDELKEAKHAYVEWRFMTGCPKPPADPPTPADAFNGMFEPGHIHGIVGAVARNEVTAEELLSEWERGMQEAKCQTCTTTEAYPLCLNDGCPYERQPSPKQASDQ